MSSVTGLEMPNAWRTGQAQDANFDISADQLNVTANREMWIPSGSVNWATALHTNALDPVSAQDLATKNYVDINGGALWSTFPATQAVDMDSNFIQNLLDPLLAQDAATMAYADANGGITWSTFPATQAVDMATFQINNLVDPTLAQDAATKNYVDTNAPATDLDALTDVTIVTLLDEQFLQFNSTSGQWENVTVTPSTPSAIAEGNSSVTVIDSGVGSVVTNIDAVNVATINATLYDIQVPISMNSQQINLLGTPTVDSDAATKVYVDDLIALTPTDLDGLTDVTITTPLINQVLVNDGAGQWVNQVLAKAQLPTVTVYTDQTNTFTETQQFGTGLQLGAGQVLDLQGSDIIDTLSIVFNETVTPATPILTDSAIYLADGSDFNSSNPLLQILIDRDGTIEKKPIVTSETVFALRNFTNGMFTDETGVELITDGGIGIRLQQFNETNRANSYELVLDGQLFIIESPDTSPGVSNTIDLTVGTDILPTLHFIWIALSVGIPTMTSSTVGFPTSGDFAVVGRVLLQSQASVLADGPYADLFPDYEIVDNDMRGHLSHINDRLSELDAAYLSGLDITVVPTVGGGTAAEVTFSTTIGNSFELHREDLEAYDIAIAGSIANVANEGTQSAFQLFPVTNIGTDMVGLTCANGTTVISNNDNINVVLFTIHIDTEPNQTNYGINLPTDVYNGGGADADSIADVNGFAVRNVPLVVRGTALLVAEVVIKITGGGATFEVLAIKDLRGQIPGAASSGGSSGGGGATQLDELTDVTLVSPILDNILQFDGAGQWKNVVNPAGILLDSNLWSDFQDFKAIADPGAGTTTEGRFFTEVIDANNTGLFCYLNQDGIIQKLRLA